MTEVAISGSSSLNLRFTLPEIPVVITDAGTIFDMISSQVPHSAVILNPGHSDIFLRPARRGEALSPLLAEIVSGSKVFTDRSSPGSVAKRYLVIDPEIIKNSAFVQDVEGRSKLIKAMVRELSTLDYILIYGKQAPYIAESTKNPTYERRRNAIMSFLKMCVDSGFGDSLQNEPNILARLT